MVVNPPEKAPVLGAEGSLVDANRLNRINWHWIENEPVTGSTVFANPLAASLILGRALTLSFPSSVRITPGTIGSASRNFCWASGNVSNCVLLTVEAGEEVSVERFAACSLTSHLFHYRVESERDVDHRRLIRAKRNRFCKRP